MKQGDASVNVLAGIIVTGGMICLCIVAAICRAWNDPQERSSMPPALWMVSVAVSGIVACLLVFPINDLAAGARGLFQRLVHDRAELFFPATGEAMPVRPSETGSPAQTQPQP